MMDSNWRNNTSGNRIPAQRNYEICSKEKFCIEGELLWCRVCDVPVLTTFSDKPYWPSSLTDWIEQCFTSPPTQYRLYGRRFLQIKRASQSMR